MNNRLFSFGTLLMVAMCLTGLSLNAANYKGGYPCPTFDLKKHQFGFGVSTALCDNVKAVNQYLNAVEYRTVFSFHTVQSSFVALYFDYQYRFNDSWSLNARLKYKHRHTLCHLNYSTGDSYGRDGAKNFDYYDLAIPVTANFRWVNRKGASLELFAGLGITTLGLAGRHESLFDFGDYRITVGTLGLYFDRKIDPYGVCGFEFEIPFQKFVMKPFVSYSYSPISHAQYAVKPSREGTAVPHDMHSAPLHLSELEVGLIMQF